MSTPRQLTLALRINSTTVREHVLRLLDELDNEIRLMADTLDLTPGRVVLDDDNATYRWFSQNVDLRPEHLAILVSDELVEGEVLRDGTWTYMPNGFTKEFVLKFEGHVATLALMGEPQRVTDIDRVISTNCTLMELRHAVTMCARKLDYLDSPPRKSSLSPSQIHVRRIDSVTELGEYFKLRHDVYSLMGYLPLEVEACGSGLEINWNDRNAIPLGAFLRQPNNREVMVGTARLALTQLSETNSNWRVLRTFEGWAKQLALPYPVATTALDRTLLLELPILHSVRQMVSPKMLAGGPFGELSRVIVAREFRGVGISTLLVQRAIAEAEKIGLQRLFLECLPNHVPIYERLGFRRMDTAAARVISVKRTMLPMERVVSSPVPAANC